MLEVVIDGIDRCIMSNFNAVFDELECGNYDLAHRFISRIREDIDVAFEISAITPAECTIIHDFIDSYQNRILRIQYGE